MIRLFINQCKYKLGRRNDAICSGKYAKVTFKKNLHVKTKNITPDINTNITFKTQKYP